DPDVHNMDILARTGEMGYTGRMSFETVPQPIPDEHELPLNVAASEVHATGGDSETWKVRVTDVHEQEKLIALKQVRREAFADDAAMAESKKFYDFLKEYPGFGRFVPD